MIFLFINFVLCTLFLRYKLVAQQSLKVIFLMKSCLVKGFSYKKSLQNPFTKLLAQQRVIAYIVKTGYIKKAGVRLIVSWPNCLSRQIVYLDKLSQKIVSNIDNLSYRETICPQTICLARQFVLGSFGTTNCLATNCLFWRTYCLLVRQIVYQTICRTKCATNCLLLRKNYLGTNCLVYLDKLSPETNCLGTNCLVCLDKLSPGRIVSRDKLYRNQLFGTFLQLKKTKTIKQL